MLRDLLRAEDIVIGRDEGRHIDAANGDRSGVSPAEYRRRSPLQATRFIHTCFAARSSPPAEPRLGNGHHLHPDGAGFYVSGGSGGLVQPAGSGLEIVNHAGGGDSASRRLSGAARPARPAGDAQHRSGQPIHQRRLPPVLLLENKIAISMDAARRPGADNVFVERLLALGEIRRGVSARLCQRRRGQSRARPVSELLQWAAPTFQPRRAHAGCRRTSTDQATLLVAA